MPFDIYREIVDQAAAAGTVRIMLYWMADPFGDPLILEKIRYASDKGPVVYLSTNGAQLTPELCEAVLESGFDGIRFSVEGVEPTVYEGTRRGLSYDTTVRNLQAFFRLKREKGLEKPRTEMRTVYMESTRDTLTQYLRQWREDCDQIDIASIANWAGTIDHELRRNAGKEEVRRAPCGKLWDLFCFSWEGIASPCFFDHDLKYPLGSIRERSLIDLFNHELLVELRQMHLEGRYSDHPLCAECDENVAPEDNPTLVLQDPGGKRIVLERHNARDREEIMRAIPREYRYAPVAPGDR